MFIVAKGQELGNSKNIRNRFDAFSIFMEVQIGFAYTAIGRVEDRLTGRWAFNRVVQNGLPLNIIFVLMSINV
jgi:hypothetical protein